MTDVARERDGVLTGSENGAGGRMDHPKKAVRTATSDGSERVAIGVGVVSRCGVDGGELSRTLEEGSETDEMMLRIEWIWAAVYRKTSQHIRADRREG